MDTSVIGRIIAQKRKEKHMTQEVLAQKLNVTAKTISHWENGYTLPDISLLIPLSNILGSRYMSFYPGSWKTEKQ